MKKLITVALTIGLLAGSMVAPAEAGKKKKDRKMEIRYENPTFGVGGVGGLCAGCPQFATGKGERFLAVEIVDDVSPVGYVEISFDSDGDGVYDSGETVCGATDGKIEVPENTTFVAFPYATPGPFCPGASFAGTLKLTFSKSP